MKLVLTTKYAFTIIVFIIMVFNINAQENNTNKNKFRQLGQELPTPTAYRTASGAPGHEYWQQKANYKMNIRLDDENQRIYGEETITYFNNSPDPLNYLWLQLDQNMRAKDSDRKITATETINEKMSFEQIQILLNDFNGGFRIEYVKDINHKDIPYTINKTMMRVDIPKTLNKGESYSFKVKWWYNINDRIAIGGRSGYEYFADDDNYLYTIAQFFPRMCVYNDTDGWQHKQFLGRGEFTLAFGDYEVELTVPEDHTVSATGVLQNPEEVLTKTENQRFEKARTTFDEPVIIVTEDEAIKKESSPKNKKMVTWIFTADNVRDFAFASSRKFIWDAMAVKQNDGSTVMAMSMYPKEGNPLWEKYSTKSVAHTLKWYSYYTFSYPYPVAWSVHTDKIGMEYPMICFNGGRPEKDGTYTARTKYGLISVIIHEVGHNYFPMIVNSDERQWTWMDEGLNSYLQFLTEQEWERDYPSRRGPPKNIINYMSGDKKLISPIMTNSESIFQFGNNAYGKPATALNILRETIVGRELFDFAFKEYSRRWMFKHPSPSDFFRTIEDASGTDLDWFWRGWFYTTDHVDQAISKVKWYNIDTKNPEIELSIQQTERDQAPRDISSIRNEKTIAQTQDEIDRSLRDFYTEYDPLNVTMIDQEQYQSYYNKLPKNEKELLKTKRQFYEITFKNYGGLIMPLIVQFEFTNGEKEVHRIPAEIWRKNHEEVSKVFITENEIKQITLDPFLETADIDTGNNSYPPRQSLSRFELFKEQQWKRENPMQKDKRSKEKIRDTN